MHNLLVKRVYHTFSLSNTELFKQQMLSWANRFNICCFLDNHQYPSANHSYECLVAVGVHEKFIPNHNFFVSLSSFIQQHDDWLFGHFNYDIKNEIEEGLQSSHPDETDFPECFLFIPEVLLTVKSNELTIGVLSGSASELYFQITQEVIRILPTPTMSVSARMPKEKYIEAVHQLIHHIHIGDCYVLNYCQEFFANASIDPMSVYSALKQISPNPFGAYYRLMDKYLMCASPERFLKKEGNKIISQPIKGTAPRDLVNPIKDEGNKELLYNDRKERGENVMVVDLVRNDMSKVCKSGTVKVDELFGMYRFPSVHQMISTVSGILEDGIEISEIIKAMFPMGSMTGAPKRRVMELIEQYEYSKRGIYSGTIGYITPDKDMDFNVVIRSLVYNQTTSYLSYHVGSAITAYCTAEKEYEECLLKGETMRKVLLGNPKN